MFSKNILTLGVLAMLVISVSESRNAGHLCSLIFNFILSGPRHFRNPAFYCCYLGVAAITLQILHSIAFIWA